MTQLLLATTLWQRLAGVSLGYWLVWCALVGLSVTIVLLMRARWGHTRTIEKCAVLSLLVHLVFACLAMTVRIVVGDSGGSATGPPIRVRIVEDVSTAIAKAPHISDAQPEVSPPALIDRPAESTPDVVKSVPLLEPMPATEEAKLAEDGPSKPTESKPASDIPVLVDDAIAPELLQTDEPAGNPRELAPLPVATTQSPAPSLPEPPIAAAPLASSKPVDGAYALRSAPGRLGVVESQGGNLQTEAAVVAALRWLAAAQSPDGRWDADRFGAGRELEVFGHNRRGAGKDADTGISALALLAFLGAGHSHVDGDYQETVRRGLDFLVRAQAADGSLFGTAELYAQMYCHSMATFALAEAAALTGDKQLLPSVTRAANYSIRAQNSLTGGWRYRPGDTGDTSQLGWQIMALASAQRAGLSVPRETWLGVERFLRSVRRGTYGGLASYRPDGPASTPMTAEALYCRLLLAETSIGELDDPSAAEATGQMLAALPDGDRVNLYYWYYATLALHHRQQASDSAAVAWHAWNDALTAVLLNRQVASGPDAGSWNTDCLWGGYGGRVYTTAMSAMCLEVYYRYAPQPRSNPRVATRSARESSR